MTNYTTIYITPTEKAQLHKLAIKLGLTQTYAGQTIGNLSGLAQHLAALVETHTAPAVAAALAGLGQEQQEDNNDEPQR
jgi:hypothetical protein